MKRFYKTVSTKSVPEGFEILLDTKPVKTQSGQVLNAKNETLAQKVMLEWSEQADQIIPDTMPLTQILNTEIDRVSSERPVMQKTVLNYLDTDLLCYWASDPQAQVQKQQELWQPWLDWFGEKFGHKLEITTDLHALKHPQALHDAVFAYVDGLDNARFTALQIATSVSGSLILGIVAIEQAATSQQLLDAIYLAENFKSDLYNAEKYGVDPMLEKAKKQSLLDLQAVQDFVSCLGQA